MRVWPFWSAEIDSEISERVPETSSVSSSASHSSCVSCKVSSKHAVLAGSGSGAAGAVLKDPAREISEGLSATAFFRTPAGSPT